MSFYSYLERIINRKFLHPLMSRTYFQWFSVTHIQDISRMWVSLGLQRNSKKVQQKTEKNLFTVCTTRSSFRHVTGELYVQKKRWAWEAVKSNVCWLLHLKSREHHISPETRPKASLIGALRWCYFRHNWKSCLSWANWTYQSIISPIIQQSHTAPHVDQLHDTSYWVLDFPVHDRKVRYSHCWRTSSTRYQVAHA